MEPILELPIRVAPRGARVSELHRQLRAAIIEGRLKPGLRLPPTRALAVALGVSRNTAMATYDLLLAEGYVEARQGAGTYVAAVLPHQDLRIRAPWRPQADETRLNDFWRTAVEEERATEVASFDFRLGVPELEGFPMEIWRRLSARALRTHWQTSAHYSTPHGEMRLREAIAAHVSFARAVACQADDITVTSGAQQALDLLARILVTRDRTVVAVEDPGYPPARTSFAAAGAKVVPVPVDEEGLVVDALPAGVDVIYVTPSHQFPLGVAMSAQRRAALLEVAASRGAVVIEDDYDAEFRYTQRPLDALQTLDRTDSVFYVGTFSKSLFPALRLGFVAAPAWAHGALGAARRCADRQGNSWIELTLAAFISEGHLARHVRRMRRVYAARREALLQGLEQGLRRWLTPLPSAAGLHLAALGSPDIDVPRLIERAREREVGVRSLQHFCAGRRAPPGLAFGYGAITEGQIAEGLKRLRQVLISLSR
jgi:GntR family transcriptional regulator/MocR family aminotransferase